MWTRHPHEDGHHLATHPGAAWVQQEPSAVAGKDSPGFVPEQEHRERCPNFSLLLPATEISAAGVGQR